MKRIETASGERVVEEARVFMADYARDLLAGDRAAIAARCLHVKTVCFGSGWRTNRSTQAAYQRPRPPGKHN